jgi:hypothetical protein
MYRDEPTYQDGDWAPRTVCLMCGRGEWVSRPANVVAPLPPGQAERPRGQR